MKKFIIALLLVSSPALAQIEDPAILATDLEYRNDLEVACTAENPEASRSRILSDIDVLVNLSGFVPPVGMNGLTKKEVAAIAEQRDYVYPQYVLMRDNLKKVTCS